MRYFVLIIVATLEGLASQDLLVDKAKLMVSMMNTSVDPCENFFDYANGNAEQEFAKEQRMKAVRGPLVDPSYTRGIDSIDALRTLYSKCQSSVVNFVEYTVEDKMRMAVSRFAGLQLPMQKTDTNVQTFSNYCGVLSRFYSLFFDIGHPLLQDFVDGIKLGGFLFPTPVEMLEDEDSKKVWDTYCAKVPCASRETYRDEEFPYDRKEFGGFEAQTFINMVMGVPVALNNMTVLVFDGGEELEDEIPTSRAALINFLFETLMLDSEVEYETCEELVHNYYPLHVNKMVLDVLKGTGKIKPLEDHFYTTAEMILHEAGRTVNESKVIQDELKVKMMERWKHNKYAFLDHAVYDDGMFRRYFNFIDVTKPYSTRWVNTFRPLFKYLKDQGGSMAYIPNLLGENAFHTRSGGANFFDWGLMTYPSYDPSWPPYLTFSTNGYVMAHETAHTFAPMRETSEEFNLIKLCVKNLYTGVCNPTNVNVCVDPTMTLYENMADQFGLNWAFQAYKRWGLHKEQGVRMKSAVLSKFTDDQLFFISLAQNEASHRGWDLYEPEVYTHAPSVVRVWRAFANFPGFINAFSCPEGSKYNIRKKCKLLNNDLDLDEDIVAKYVTVKKQ